MRIECKREADFSSLYVGDFFTDGYGKLYLKIPQQHEYNAISFNDIQECDPALYVFNNDDKCRKCKGKIIIN